MFILFRYFFLDAVCGLGVGSIYIIMCKIYICIMGAFKSDKQTYYIVFKLDFSLT